MSERVAALLHRFDNWERSSEFTRTCKNPVDAGDQMALRDAHKLLQAAIVLLDENRCQIGALKQLLAEARQQAQAPPKAPVPATEPPRGKEEPTEEEGRSSGSSSALPARDGETRSPLRSPTGHTTRPPGR